MNTTLEQRLEETGKFIREYNKVPIEDRIEELPRPRFIIDMPVGIDYINQQNYRHLYMTDFPKDPISKIYSSRKYRWFFTEERYHSFHNWLFEKVTSTSLGPGYENCLIPL